MGIPIRRCRTRASSLAITSRAPSFRRIPTGPWRRRPRRLGRPAAGMAAAAGWGGTWAIIEEEEEVEGVEVGRRWVPGKMDTGAFAEEEAPDREEGRPTGDGWGTEAYRAGSGGGESGFPMGRVGGGMAEDGGEGIDREGLGAKRKALCERIEFGTTCMVAD